MIHSLLVKISTFCSLQFATLSMRGQTKMGAKHFLLRIIIAPNYFFFSFNLSSNAEFQLLVRAVSSEHRSLKRATSLGAYSPLHRIADKAARYFCSHKNKIVRVCWLRILDFRVIPCHHGLETKNSSSVISTAVPMVGSCYLPHHRTGDCIFSMNEDAITNLYKLPLGRQFSPLFPSF